MIPKILHYSFGLKNQCEHFPLYYYLSVFITKSVINPDRIFFWYANEPLGEWWYKLKPFIIPIQIPLPINTVDSDGYQKYLDNYKFRTDLIKLEVLIKYGGIFLNLDVIIVNNIDSILYTDKLILDSIENTKLMMSDINCSILMEWFENYGDYYHPIKYQKNKKELFGILTNKYNVEIITQNILYIINDKFEYINIEQFVYDNPVCCDMIKNIMNKHSELEELFNCNIIDDYPIINTININSDIVEYCKLFYNHKYRKVKLIIKKKTSDINPVNIIINGYNKNIELNYQFDSNIYDTILEMKNVVDCGLIINKEYEKYLLTKYGFIIYDNKIPKLSNDYYDIIILENLKDTIDYNQNILLLEDEYGIYSLFLSHFLRGIIYISHVKNIEKLLEIISFNSLDTKIKVINVLDNKNILSNISIIYNVSLSNNIDISSNNININDINNIDINYIQYSDTPVTFNSNNIQKIIINTNKYKLKKIDENIKEKKLLVIGLIKNISNNIGYLKFFMNELKGFFKQVSFFYLTNNNTDNTIEILEEWKKQDNNISGIIIPDETINVIDNRVNKLAHYRNLLFKNAKQKYGVKYDLMLHIDTDFIVNISIRDFISCFELDEKFDIICSNGVYKNSFYHYDSFALRLLNEPDNIQELYPKYNQYFGKSVKWITKVYSIDTWTKVKSAWGGMMLFPRKIFKQDYLYDINIDPNECEHINLCKKFQNIYINPNLTFVQDYNLEGQCYQNPLCFIPRDAGFFSVFNFYIGMLTLCGRIYPYWTLNKFIEVNGKPKHFCYLENTDNNYNTWFEYFEPVKFYINDQSHLYDCSGFKISQGIEAPDEFRIPNKTRELFSDDLYFKNWRNNIHTIYKKYIKLSKKLDIHIKNTIRKIFKENYKTIAVHYRHPSHCCEQGNILLEHYFSKIDKILLNHPNVNIFLATDTDFGVMAFKQKYGNKLIYNKNTIRTSLDNILEWAYNRGISRTDGVGFINGKGFELQHSMCNENISNINLGYDVITDVYCLAYCDWFIYTISNLSLAVSYINPKVNMIQVKL